MNTYRAGQLVRINTLRTATSDGMCTARAAPDNCIIVSENIDLESYPSYHDFSGKHIKCEEGQMATIVSYLGRPWKIRKSRRFSDYDVYEVLVNDTICHIFAVNLMTVDDTL